MLHRGRRTGRAYVIVDIKTTADDGGSPITPWILKARPLVLVTPDNSLCHDGAALIVPSCAMSLTNCVDGLYSFPAVRDSRLCLTIPPSTLPISFGNFGAEVHLLNPCIRANSSAP